MIRKLVKRHDDICGDTVSGWYGSKTLDEVSFRWQYSFGFVSVEVMGKRPNCSIKQGVQLSGTCARCRIRATQGGENKIGHPAAQ